MEKEEVSKWGEQWRGCHRDTVDPEHGTLHEDGGSEGGKRGLRGHWEGKPVGLGGRLKAWGGARMTLRVFACTR